MIALQIISHVATAYNTLDCSLFEPLLADDFVYESQMNFEPIKGKQKFIEYIKGKFETIKNANAIVFAEIGYIGTSNQQGSNIKIALSENTPCIIMAQGSKENKGALLLIEVKDDLVTRIDICTNVPHWSAATRTNEYPGLV